MAITIALAGNPNCGKTTLFNALTGSSQRVGNWPGVTVEHKEGHLKGNREVVITDLPGVYSLSPYTLEEVVTRDYLIGSHPSVVLNLVDATNIERNLYLTTQLLEVGIPVVVALNMCDLLKKNGTSVDTKALERELGCPVVEISALKGDGIDQAMAMCMDAATAKAPKPLTYAVELEKAIDELTPLVQSKAAGSERYHAIKLFERDEKVLAQLGLDDPTRAAAEKVITECEASFDDDAEGIVTGERYAAIADIVAGCVRKKAAALSTSDKVDRIVTNRVLALPIFVCVMFLVYAIAMGGWSFSIGTNLTDWANDGLFGDGWHVPFTTHADANGVEWEDALGEFEEAEAIIEAYEAGESEAFLLDGDTGETTVIELDEDTYSDALTVEEPDPSDYGVWVPGIPVLVESALDAINCNEVVSGLILDGIVGGVGAVLGFVPQMLILFILLAILEDIGYMARVAFIMDRIFRRFGLSGKSFIPMLIATGCGVPGVMASRTIEQDKDRKMTIMTTCFIPCGAKMPIIAMFAGALFGGSALVAVSAFFIGIAAVIISGVILKKFKAFAGDPAPFVMELPAYHIPTVSNVLRAMWERGWSFIKRAGTVILLSSIVLWFLQGFGFTDGSFGMVDDNNNSLLAYIGNGVSWIFAPLGIGSWQMTVATVTGLIAKEEVVGTMGVLYPGVLYTQLAAAFTGITAYSFMIFNLLCAPCFAAMGAIKREMNNAKWTWAAIGYMCGFAYVISLIVYQLGNLFAGGGFGVGTVVGIVALAALLFLIFRPNRYKNAEAAEKQVSSIAA